MRKIIKSFILFIFALTLSQQSYAQLNVVSDANDYHCLLTCRKYGNYPLYLMEHEGTYYIACNQTDKQIDKEIGKYCNGITLGTTREGCLATLSDLLEVVNKNKRLTVHDETFGLTKLSAGNMLGVLFLYVKSSSNIGRSAFYEENLERIRDYIEKNIP